jgi:lysophospholipase L1-like esterase
MESSPSAAAWKRIRSAAVLLGLAVIAVAVWGHHVGLGSGSTMGRVRWLVLLVGLGIVAAGVLGPRIVAAHRAIAIVLLNTLIALIGLELASAVGLALVGRSAPTQTFGWTRDNAESPKASYYASQPWAEAYWDEFELAYQHTYHPYYLWRLKPYAGRLIRIGPAGLRETPGARCVEGAYRVFVFGGSTVWGMGSPDSGTIPAHLQALLAERLSRPVCVVNFGQLGFTTAQDVVQLEAELRAGNVPDLALFYGGVNDYTTAFIFGQTGIHFNLTRIARAYEELRKPKPAPGVLDLVRQTNAFRLAAELRRPPGTPLLEGQTRYFDSDSLAQAVVNTFASNHRQVDLLGRGYGFKAAFFWQPSVSDGDKPLTEEEQRFLENEQATRLGRKTYPMAKARMADTPGLYYLGGVFAAEPATMYIDSHHLTPEANRRAALAILDRIQAELPASSRKAQASEATGA